MERNSSEKHPAITVNSAHVSNKAFTLVELIVVIVILAILATIAFLSFSSQSSSARDSGRLANITNISKWLSIFFTLGWSYPTPDKMISITASWTPIRYQGIVGDQTSRMIKISVDGWKDPLDGNYFSYITNSKKTKYQLVWFLENSQNSEISLNPIMSFDWVSAASNSWRYLITRWDSLWILMTSWSIDPIYSSLSNTWIDILNTDSTYTIYYSKDEVVTWTWIKLKSWISGWWIVWYWWFDEWTWTWVNDLSMNGHDMTLIWPNFPTWNTGPIWWNLDFSAWQFTRIMSWSIVDYWAWDYTLSFNLYYSWALWAGGCWAWYTRVISNAYSYPSRWFVVDLWTNCLEYEWWVQANWNMLYTNGQFNHTLQPNSWHNITFVWNRWASQISAYVNWNIIGTNKYKTWFFPSDHANYRSWSLTDTPDGIFYDSNKQIDIWATNAFTWILKIDEMRMYNRVLSDFEVESVSALVR
ncbi:MAG: hypothetical protein ACD_3C00223G0022 [uncultured bacterium (gcode 4)]|uniref:Prepilin-type N-terminal cleavage/methylation domain-containing protein n=1 Tax=uncultured bacterium (gcode 4) TaxID=1234023 RepID=K2GVJ4_9BACT|nr:MAG: hypothetical protein ACD_3C00223G0022 [uncultured bacterium (gcode 4)]